jgi:phosphohistidine phosphatase
MRLVLFRHGIAIDRDDPAAPEEDAERPLTAKGVKRTRQAVRGLARLVPTVDVLLSSPLLRARQTADLVAEGLDVGEKRRRVIEALDHDRPPGELFAELARLGEVETVVCVGHAPNLDDVLRFALDEGADAVSALGKAGAACVELDEPGQPGGQLRWLLPPSLLRRLG